MDFLKDLFGGGALSFEQFAEKVKNAKMNLADLSKGEYVSKEKYTQDTNTLNNTIKMRDTDLAAIQEQLKKAGVDKTKLDTLSSDLAALKTKYDDDTKQYQAQLEKQAYEFAVKEFANTQHFTSTAAKRDFIRSMTERQLTLEKGKITGADDYLNEYKADNSDSFMNTPSGQEAKPTFTASTTPQATDGAVTKEQFAKMGYSARNELYANNRELYEALTKE